MAFTCRGYGRCSTDKQAISIEAQRRNVEDAFALYKRIKPGWEDAEWGGWFEDRDVSRTTKFRERDKGRQVFNCSERGDVIMASNYDRMFARALDVCETLEEVKNRGIRLSILDFPMEISDGLGEACFLIISVVKNVEVQAIRERTRKALAHRKSEGLPSGGQCPVGWNFVHCVVDGARRSYFSKDHNARKLGELLVRRKAELGYNTHIFYAWCKAKGWLNHKGEPWTENTFRHFLQAAEAGFPLPNGKLTAPKIPPNAKNIEIIDET